MSFRTAMDKFRGHETPHVRFIERKKIWFALSGFFILLSIVGLVVRGLNFSIDFNGGTLLTYPCPKCASGDVTVNDIEATLAKAGFTDSQVQIVNGTTVSVRTESLTALSSQPHTSLTLQSSTASVEDLRATLAKYGYADGLITSTPSTTRRSQLSRNSLTLSLTSTKRDLKDQQTFTSYAQID